MSPRRSQRLIKKCCSNSMDILEEMTSEKLEVNQKVLSQINKSQNSKCNFDEQHNGLPCTNGTQQRSRNTQRRKQKENKAIDKTRSPEKQATRKGRRPKTTTRKSQYADRTRINPMTPPLPQPKVMPTIERYFDNNAYVYSQKIPTILPPVYPAHFINQLPHESQTLDGALYVAIPTQQQYLQHVNGDTQATAGAAVLERPERRSSSTLSLSDSLRDIFQVNDVRELLSMDRVIYRLCKHHVLAMAMVLNLNVTMLENILDAIVQFSAETVEQIKSVFMNAEQMSIVRTSSPEPNGGSTIADTPTTSATQSRHFPSQRRCDY